MENNINESEFHHKLKNFFNEKIRLSFVTNNNIIIVTKDDNVYEFKKKDIKNSNIAFSDDNHSVKNNIAKSFIKDLSKKMRIDFMYGWNELIALTWKGRLCHTSEKNKFKQYLKYHNITDIYFFDEKTIELRDEGFVYDCDQNDEDSDDVSYSLIEFNGEKVCVISLGCVGITLTELNHIYCWAYNHLRNVGQNLNETKHNSALNKLNSDHKHCHAVKEFNIFGRGSFGNTSKVNIINKPEKSNYYALKNIKFSKSKGTLFWKEKERSHVFLNNLNKSIVKYFDVWLRKSTSQVVVTENLIFHIQMELTDKTLYDHYRLCFNELENYCKDSREIFGLYIFRKFIYGIHEAMIYFRERKIPRILQKDWNIMLKINDNHKSFIKLVNYKWSSQVLPFNKKYYRSFKRKLRQSLILVLN